MIEKLALLTCLASTFFMTGLIWFVHVVHYPLFDRITTEAFARYHAAHTRTTAIVVVSPMVLELLSSVILVVRCNEEADYWLVWLGLALAIASWGLTFFFSVPAHNRLSSGFDAGVHRRLVSTNTLRILSWSGHSVVLLVLTFRMLR